MVTRLQLATFEETRKPFGAAEVLGSIPGLGTFYLIIFDLELR